MNALMTAIVLWLSANFNLPATFEHPKVEIVSHAEIAAMRYGPFQTIAANDAAVSRHPSATGQREVVAIYNIPKATIYLPEGWTGNTPAELSVLVHELVHHLQNRSGAKFACVQESEAAAYAAQERWLGLFGHNLLTDFEVDPFTVLVSAQCTY